ncbi:hypothetical protein CVT26_000221 [Gymnopilus dilepis]|uniref:Uncharacterized protein n=1 Tax=Gymnopilus dilepis TaxID=231916 RepID=A0A409VG64_9AGAR|nr:hypothetical protein CVT26_000221 [Gymnopilus dilepis]
MASTRYLLPRQRICSTFNRFSNFHAGRRFYSANGEQAKSRHSAFYSDTLPAMIPIFLLGSAVFLGLQLMYLKLSHEKFMDESMERVKALEAEIDALQQKRTTTSQSNAGNKSSEQKDSTRRSWW